MNKLQKTFSTWRGLPLQLFLLVIMPFAVLALAATLMSLGLHQNAMRSMVAERDVRSVVTAAHFLESRLQMEQEVSNVLAMQSETRSLETIVREHNYASKNLGLVSKQGVLLAFSGLEDIKSAMSSLSFVPGEIRSANINRNIALVFSSVAPSGAIAVNIVMVEPLLVEILGNDFAAQGQETAFLVDANFKELARLGKMPTDENRTTHPGIVDALSGKSGFTYMKTSSMEHVVAYSPVTPPGWALVIEEPWEEVDTPYLRLTQFAPLILIPLLAFTLVALWFGATQIVKPLQQLENLASKLAWGDFNAIEKSVGGVQEIQQLQNELIHMAGKVQDAQKSLHNYIGAITRGQEDERSRLARELHDDTLQALIALSQRVRLAQMKATDEPMQQALAELDSLASNSIVELRRVTRGLRPIYLEDLGLVTALEMLARENTSPGLSVDFSCEGTERRLEKALELTLFRIVQEGLNNVIHHAEASQAWITLNFQATDVTLKIRDNGKGFTPPKNPAEFAPGGHYGLLGMHERSDLAGGKFSITSSEKGTEIQIMVKEAPSQ